jgi:hypothetical protein
MFKIDSTNSISQASQLYDTAIGQQPIFINEIVIFNYDIEF